MAKGLIRVLRALSKHERILKDPKELLELQYMGFG